MKLQELLPAIKLFNFLVPIEIVAPLNKFMEGVDEDTISRSEESLQG